MTIPLGVLGEIGVANHGGLLALTVPWTTRSCAVEEGLSLDGTTKVAKAWAGMRASLPLGEVRLEVGASPVQDGRTRAILEPHRDAERLARTRWPARLSGG